MSQSNHWRYASCLCSEWWSKMGQAPPLAELSYNNSYQESIKMSPFKALYGRPCRTPLSWSESGKRVIFGPNIVTEAEEKVKQIRANILTAQSRQNSYTDKRHHPWSLKWVITYTFESPQWKVYVTSASKEASSPLHWHVSYHRQVWANVLSGGATIKAIRSE
jgi:hypothetical protein